VRDCVQFEISEKKGLNMQGNVLKIKPYIIHIFFKLGEIVGMGIPSVICRDWGR
jgi:hypothetical protein